MKHSARPAKRGFTLIEMLAVVTIIVILVAVVVGGMGFAKDRRALAQAELQVKLLASALEEYKMENGVYPPTTDPEGRRQSNVLFRALYWDGDQDPNRKIYVSELDPQNNRQGWTEGLDENTMIMDPWGNEYFYRTGPSARNPDFDLWSAGKDGATNPDSPGHRDNADDIRS